MITQHFAEQFAQKWIAAWNSHELTQILSHYSEDFEMISPFIAKMTQEPNGRLQGKAAVGAYWQKALDTMPDLRFELIEVLSGVDSVCIYYHSVLNMRGVEWFWFGADGKVQKAIAHYNSDTHFHR
jgi:ketosteroid isomerase-like protein